MPDTPPRLFIIDGYGYVFRAYYALPPLTRSDGLPVGAVAGFCNMLFKLLRDAQRSGKQVRFLVALDHGSPTFRHKLYEHYKANRTQAPPELRGQFSIIRDAIKAFGIPFVEKQGFEADDIIATYAERAKDKHCSLRIVSADKDLMQLIDDDQDIDMFDPVKFKLLKAQDVFDKFGLWPTQLIDMQALVGDSSDNVPGAPGIGPKTAAILLHDQTLEKLLERTADIAQKKRRETLETFREQILLSKKLVTLDRNVPLDLSLEELFDRTETFSLSSLVTFLDAMELDALKKRILKENTTPLTQPSQTQNDSAPISTPTPAPSNPFSTVTENYPAYTDPQKLLMQLHTQTHCFFTLEAPLDLHDLHAHQDTPIPLTLSILTWPSCHRALYVATDRTQRENLSKILVHIMEDGALRVVGWNLKDVWHFLAHDIKENISPQGFDDLSLMAYLIQQGQHSHSTLKDACNRYLEPPINTQQQDNKNAREGVCPHDIARLWEYLSNQLFKQRQMRLYHCIDKPLLPLLFEMEQRGIALNINSLEEIKENIQHKLKELEKSAITEAGESFNLASPQQVGEVFLRLGYPLETKTKTGQAKTDVSILEMLATQGYTLANTVLEWRTFAKLKTTYIDVLAKLVTPEHNRVHTRFLVTSTRTGRLSSKSPNLQNIPIRTHEGRDIRRCFVASPGFVLLSADYTQIELKLLSCMGPVPKLLSAFKSGEDIHSATAQRMFGNVDAQTRRKAKAINFGIIYGISAFGLARQLGITPKEASDYIKEYFNAFEGLLEYANRTTAFMYRHGFVETLFGRKIGFEEALKTPKASLRKFYERAAINAPLQGSAADIIRLAMTRFDTQHLTETFEARLLLQIHDELVFEVKEDKAPALGAFVHEIMETAHMSYITLPVTLNVDVGWDENWQACKK